MQYFTTPNMLLAVGALSALVTLVKAVAAPNTIAYKIADKASALVIDVHKFFGA